MHFNVTIYFGNNKVENFQFFFTYLLLFKGIFQTCDKKYLLFQFFLEGDITIH
jgi:hypothetical protein